MKYFLLLLLFIITACSGEEKKVVAEVGDTPIYINDFIQRYEDYLFSSGINDKLIVRQNILNQMIDETLLENYDNNSDLENEKSYQVEKEWTRKQAILAYLKDQEVYAKINVTDNEARQAYQRMNQKIAARHIYASTKDEADYYYDLLKSGVTFEKLAKEAFSDSILSNNGGYVGYFTWGDFDPAFEEAAYGLKVGEISKPVQLENGYSIIKVEDKVTKPIITEYDYMTHKNQIMSVVKINKKRPAEEAYIRGLVDFSKFKFFDDKLEQLYAGIFGDSSRTMILKEEEDKSSSMNYKGRNYTNAELTEKLLTVPSYHLRKATDIGKFKAILKGLVLQDKLMEEALNKGYQDVPAVEKMNKKMQKALFMKYKRIDILRKYNVSDSLVYDYYLKNPDFFSSHNELNIQEIIVQDSILAVNILNKIKGGKDFGTLAKSYSVRKETAEKDGKVGFVNLTKFGNLAQVFWKSGEGDILGPFNLNEYFGIFKVLGKKKGKLLDFDEVKDDAEIIAKYKYQKQFYDLYLSNLKSKVKISINLKLLGGTKINSNTEIK